MFLDLSEASKIIRFSLAKTYHWTQQEVDQAIFYATKLSPGLKLNRLRITTEGKYRSMLADAHAEHGSLLEQAPVDAVKIAVLAAESGWQDYVDSASS